MRHLDGGGRVFVGQADDPFFVDLGTTFDAINIRNGTGNAGGGKDDLAGYNVHSVVLQVPEAEVTRDGKAVAGAEGGERRGRRVGVDEPRARRRVGGARLRPEHERRSQDEARRARTRARSRSAAWATRSSTRSSSRSGRRTCFNATQPSDDLKNFGKYVVSPQLAKVINVLFPGLNVPETNRTDIVQALLTGIPGLTQIRPGAPPTDTLKINLGVAPNPKPSRFGVIGGDTQGFPNGRRLADDVTDIELRVIGGFLKGNKLPLGDGVDQNDVPFRATFPYVAPPKAGFDSQLKRAEPEHAPTPADPRGLSPDDRTGRGAATRPPRWVAHRCWRATRSSLQPR